MREVYKPPSYKSKLLTMLRMEDPIHSFHRSIVVVKAVHAPMLGVIQSRPEVLRSEICIQTETNPTRLLVQNASLLVFSDTLLEKIGLSLQ